MYIVKIGNAYLAAEGKTSDRQCDAVRFSTQAEADMAVDIMRVRRVKLNPRQTSADNGADFD